MFFFHPQGEKRTYRNEKYHAAAGKSVAFERGTTQVRNAYGYMLVTVRRYSSGPSRLFVWVGGGSRLELRSFVFGL
jgi:hypothetical protein